ncbi:MAG: glycosyltransferase family 39 protein [Rubrobacteraceae bacterium]
MRSRPRGRHNKNESVGWPFAVYLVALAIVGLLTVGRIGVTWDEPNYFGSSYSYLSWIGHIFQNPSDWWNSIDRFWSPSHEAPPFFKLWAGLFAGAGALLLGTENLDRLGDAYRLGSYALFLFTVYAAYRFMRREFGPEAAWGAALSLPLVPALFGFARLGQLDGAAAFMYLLAAISLFDMLVRGGRGRTLGAGVLLGLAFSTKLTVFPLVFAALLWALIYRREKMVFMRLFASFGIGAAVFFAVWPWLWREPVGRTWEFLTWAGGLQDERLTFYLGQWWAGAPWHYPLASLLVFVPLVVAVAGVAGVVRLFAKGTPASGWILINLALVIAVAGSGLVPVYGGPRQFLAAFPLWALCAGAGIGWLARGLRSRPAVVLAAYAALALPGILWTGTANSLEYYGEAVGLIPGARALGFETTYLADTYRPAVEYVNEVAPEGATVYVQAGTYAVAETYRRIGDLREDLRPAYLSQVAPEKYVNDEQPRQDSYFFFLPRQSIYTDQMLALEEKEPLFAYEKGGTPLVKVYSGDAVAGTLDVEGRPEANDPGLPNALVAFGGVLAVLAGLWRKQDEGKEW